MFLVACSLGGANKAQAQGKDPFVVKAAFLCNFAKFAEWPGQAFTGADASIVIGIYGTDPFGAKLEAAASGMVVRGRPLKVRLLTNPPDKGDCHLLFVGSLSKEEAQKLEAAQPTLTKLPILTVSDQKNFAADGGCIGFVENNGAIHFQVNLAAADGAGVKLNSGLLKLADHVYKSSPRLKP